MRPGLLVMTSPIYQLRSRRRSWQKQQAGKKAPDFFHYVNQSEAGVFPSPLPCP
jgi:hypothetical protein